MSNTPSLTPSEELYWRLHGLSKILEGSGFIDESQHPHAYSTILDAMAFVRGTPQPSPTPQADSQPAMTPETVYAAIAHGDEEHRAWLLSALRAVWCGEAGGSMAQAQEPVATLHCNDVGYVWARATEVGKLMRFEQPLNLYTAPQPAPAPLSDDVVKDAARYRWLFGARTPSQVTSVQETVFKPLPQDEVLGNLQGFYMSKADVDTLVDAALAAQKDTP